MSELEKSPRYHALDSLRASMMLLGVLLHGALPYSTLQLGRYRDASTSPVFDVTITFIHIFRMPLFFMMAGFFGALLYERRGAAGMLKNRVRLVLVPLIASWFLLTPVIHAGIKFARASRKLGSVSGGFDAVPLRDFLTPQDIYHLWFLLDLMLFYLLTLGIIRLFRRADPALRERLSSRFRRFLAWRWRAFALAIPAALTLLPAPLGPLTRVTPWEALSLQLAPLLFFGLGWMLHAQVDLLPTFRRNAGSHLALGLALFPISFYATRQDTLVGGAWNDGPHLVAAGVNSLIVCLLVFGITGLYLRFLDRPLRSLRYLSDASYWIYLVHFPLVLWIAACLAPLQGSAVLKLSILLCLAVPAMLLCYHLCVRSTFLGLALNGRRIGRESSGPQAPPGIRKQSPTSLTASS